MTEEQPETSREAQTEHEAELDPFENLVLDDDFVRGGSYEPPARTRVAIARFGGRQTSWRHGGGLHDQSRQGRGDRSEPSPIRHLPGKAQRPRRRPLTSSAESKLPIIVTVVVVAIAALLIFR